MSNQTLEFQGYRINCKDNGDGTFSPFTHDIGSGLTNPASIEIQGYRMCINSNGDGTYSVCTTTSTGATDVTVEHEGWRIKIHPVGQNDPIITTEAMYAFLISSTTGSGDQGLEYEGTRLGLRANGDGTFAIMTTQTTAGTDITIERQGLHLKVHQAGENDPVAGTPLYAFNTNPV